MTHWETVAINLFSLHSLEETSNLCPYSLKTSVGHTIVSKQSLPLLPGCLQMIGLHQGVADGAYSSALCQ